MTHYSSGTGILLNYTGEQSLMILRYREGGYDDNVGLIQRRGDGSVMKRRSGQFNGSVSAYIEMEVLLPPMICSGMPTAVISTSLLLHACNTLSVIRSKAMVLLHGTFSFCNHSYIIHVYIITIVSML